MTPWLQDPDVTLYHGDCLEVLRELPSGSVHMCATSPPFYGLRDYGTGEWEGGDPDCPHRVPATGGNPIQGANKGNNNAEAAPFKDICGLCGARRVDRQIGLEETPDQYIERLVAVFREVRRVLRDDGTLWVEIGDSYGANYRTGTTGHVSEKQASNAGMAPFTSGTTRPDAGTKPKDLIGQSWLLAFALRADGWYLRSEIIWARPNPMPESVTDRPTKSHSTVFLLSKQPRYFYDADAIREPHQHDGRKVTTVVGRENSEQHRNGERWPGSGANARSVWTIPTEPTPFAHFATWPQALVRRMILAGTSERGCCPRCGGPWVRDVDRVPTTPGVTGGATPYDSHRPDGMTLRAGGFGNGSATTIGWSPSCKCDSNAGLPWNPVPCTVLDPFSGSGTTSLVARNHGRHSIGIELNEEYLKLAATRLQQLSLFSEGIPSPGNGRGEHTKGADHCEPSPPPSQSSQWQEQQPQQPHEARTE